MNTHFAGLAGLVLHRATIRKKGSDIWRVGPIQKWCRIAMVLHQVKKCAEMIGYIKIEEVFCSDTQLIAKAYDVFAQEPVEIGPPRTVERCSQAPRTFLPTEQKSTPLKTSD